MSQFLNPYNFIPCPTRTPGDKNFGDNRPPGHERLHTECVSGTMDDRVTGTMDDRVTGTMDVRIEARTPLLVPDSEYEVDNNNHVTKKVRVDDKGHPLIPPSSVRGALRSAFEIITNSRMGVPQQKTREDLRHAEKIDDLSAADHVFGWVSDSGRGQKHSSWAGQISIGPVTALDFAPDKPRTLTLAVLSSPKPHKKLEWYGSEAEGRKVYLHHHSQPANENHKKNTTNQSITGTVATGTFTFRISLRNVSEIHFGALLYLLMLQDEHYLHLGGAKPLGYGSIRLEIIESQIAIATNSEWKDSFKELKSVSHFDLEDLKKYKTDFESEVNKTFGNEVLKQFGCITKIKPSDQMIRYPKTKGERLRLDPPCPPHTK